MKDEKLKNISITLDKKLLETLQDEGYNMSRVVRKLLSEKFDEYGNKRKVKAKKSKNTIEITFSEENLKQLEKIKGKRTWKELILNLSLISVNGKKIK